MYETIRLDEENNIWLVHQQHKEKKDIVPTFIQSGEHETGNHCRSYLLRRSRNFNSEDEVNFSYLFMFVYIVLLSTVGY